jgi:Fe-S cluster biogenesis protein NfuA
MSDTAPVYSLEERIRGLVDQIDAYIAHYHGGGVKFVSFDGRTVHVHMDGACAACALQTATLHGWVEGTLKQFFPEIEKVEEA